MIIEFYGLPGAGKTAIAEALAEHAGIHVVKLASKRELVKFSLLFVLIRPFQSIYLLIKVISNSFNYEIFRYKLKFLQDRMARYQKACSLRQKNVILDECFFQTMLTLYEAKKDPKELSGFIRNISKPDILVIAHADDTIRFDRMHKRKRIPRKRFSRQHIRQWMRATQENNAIIESILSRLNTGIIKVDTTHRDAGQAAEEIRARL